MSNLEIKPYHYDTGDKREDVTNDIRHQICYMYPLLCLPLPPKNIMQTELMNMHDYFGMNKFKEFEFSSKNNSALANL